MWIDELQIKILAGDHSTRKLVSVRMAGIGLMMSTGARGRSLMDNKFGNQEIGHPTYKQAHDQATKEAVAARIWIVVDVFIGV